MKNLNKNQKILGTIAIISLVIIVVIIIASNIIKSNSLIVDESYLATTANAGSNLIANYILNGITIGGITGKMDVLDTNDATATAEDIAEGKVAYARGQKIIGTYKKDNVLEDGIEKGEIYYADFEGDGIVDGIIFADLLVGSKGNEQSSWGNYIIPKETGLKQYYISNESYAEPKFGYVTGKVISPIYGTSGKDRFYVLALEDFKQGAYYCWYYDAYGKMSDYIDVNTNDFGQGRQNTKNMIRGWNSGIIGNYVAEQNQGDYPDLWGAIQTYVGDINNPKWFVPSKSEWAAFAEEVLSVLNITSSNYYKYGLSSWCWSSTQSSAYYVYGAGFYGDGIGSGNVQDYNYVRLATTF